MYQICRITRYSARNITKHIGPLVLRTTSIALHSTSSEPDKSEKNILNNVRKIARKKSIALKMSADEIYILQYDPYVRRKYKNILTATSFVPLPFFCAGLKCAVEAIKFSDLVVDPPFLPLGLMGCVFITGFGATGAIIAFTGICVRDTLQHFITEKFDKTKLICSNENYITLKTVRIGHSAT